MTSAALQTGQRQQHTVTPRLQHAVRLLQLSSLDFAQEVHDAMGQESVPRGRGCAARRTADATIGPSGDGESASARSRRDGADGDAPYERESWSAIVVERAPQQRRRVRHRRARPDRRRRRPAPAPARPDQRAAAARSATTRSPARSSSRSTTTATCAADLERARRAERPRRRRSRRSRCRSRCKRVQSLDPPGVGARSVAECLLLQLPAIEDAAERETGAPRSSPSTSTAWPQHDVNAPGAALGSTPAAIEAVCERIRHLDPRPGWRVEPTATPVRDARRHRHARCAAAGPRRSTAPSCRASSSTRPTRRCSRSTASASTASSRASAGGALDAAQRAAALLDDPDRSPRRS